MSDIVDILIDRETANDQEVTVVKIYFASGTTVGAEDSIFDVENSKATQEIVAPVGGILVHTLAVGDTLPFGEAVARIVPPGTNDLSFISPICKNRPPVTDAIPTPPKEPQASMQAESVAAGKSRFSRAAAALAIRHGLTEHEFGSAFITTRQIEARINSIERANKSTMPERPSRLSTGTPILPRKREEIKSLGGGAGNTMLSVISAHIGHIELVRDEGDFFAGKITDLVAFEAARLMRKYPRLNAAYSDGAIELHAVVNAGIAFDEGARLMVYGIEEADKKDLPALRAEIEDALARYVERRLTPPEMTRATFTITDLSAFDLNFIFPILPGGQSCIIGITRNGVNEFALHIGFDHRVTEGLEIANFLSELRDRLLSFAIAKGLSLRCSFCDKSVDEEIGAFGGRGLVRLVNGRGADILSCHSCFTDW